MPKAKRTLSQMYFTDNIKEEKYENIEVVQMLGAGFTGEVYEGMMLG